MQRKEGIKEQKMIKETKEHNGITYEQFISEKQTEASACINSQRFVLVGNPQFNIAKNQWKFGNQLIVTLNTLKSDLDKIRVEGSNGSAYNRIEIYFSLEEGKEIIKELYNELFKEELKAEEKKDG